MCRGQALIPIESKVYDTLAIREAVNNCVAHQDYQMGEPITIVERDNGLTFSNAGTFIPGNVESVITANSPSYYYRNKHLAETMARIGMVETLGGGIIRIFKAQMRRGLTLPRYETDADHVTLTISSRISNPDLEYIFINMPDLKLEDAMALDHIQNSEVVSEGSIERLSKLGLITRDGSRYVVSRIRSQPINDTSTSGDGRSASNMRSVILKEIRERGTMTRGEILEKVRSMAAGTMTDDQIYNRTSYIIRRLTSEGLIQSLRDGRSQMYKSL